MVNLFRLTLLRIRRNLKIFVVINKMIADNNTAADVKINLVVELIKLFLLSFFISIFTIFGVLLKYKINND